MQRALKRQIGLLLCALAAVAGVAAGALFWYAPLWQPGYSTVGTQSIPPIQAQRINLNTATEEELCRLPGIGVKKAAAIVADRQQNGRFRTAEDLARVNGISDKTISALQDLICVE